jgi:catechol 2,3-dioxygenase-like lactoylglutathione lyase family enzyme
VNLVDQAIKKFDLPKVGQIGIVARDLESMVQQYAKLLDLNPWFRMKAKEQDVYFRGEKINMELDLIFAYSGGVQIELISLKSEEENIFSEVWHKGGGLHHLGFFVSDLDRKVSTFKAAGIEVLQHGRIKTSGGTVSKYAYLDTAHQCGTFLELIESRLKGRLPLPQTKLMMRIGSLTGDVEKNKV